MMIEMHYVDSSNIEAIGYDIDTHQLHVRFSKSGAAYVYYGVEEWRFDEFQQAESKGKYLSANIKGAYDYSRL